MLLLFHGACRLFIAVSTLPMPDRQLGGLTAQEAAGLLEYLAARK